MCRYKHPLRVTDTSRVSSFCQFYLQLFELCKTAERSHGYRPDMILVQVSEQNKSKRITREFHIPQYKYSFGHLQHGTKTRLIRRDVNMRRNSSSSSLPAPGYNRGRGSVFRRHACGSVSLWVRPPKWSDLFQVQKDNLQCANNGGRYACCVLHRKFTVH